DLHGLPLTSAYEEPFVQLYMSEQHRRREHQQRDDHEIALKRAPAARQPIAFNGRVAADEPIRRLGAVRQAALAPGFHCLPLPACHWCVTYSREFFPSRSGITPCPRCTALCEILRQVATAHLAATVPVVGFGMK